MIALGVVSAAMLLSLGGCYYENPDYLRGEGYYWNGVYGHDWYAPYPYYRHDGYYRDRNERYYRRHLHDHYRDRKYYRNWDHGTDWNRPHRDQYDRARPHFRNRDRHKRDGAQFRDLNRKNWHRERR